MRWKLAVASFGAGVLAVTVGIASAASLGVLDVRTLGTSSEVVATCDDTVGISWDASGSPVYSGSATVTNSTFTVSRMLLTGVSPQCNGHHYMFVIADSSGSVLASGSGTLSVPPNTVTLPFPAINSKTVEQVTVTIYE